MITRLLLGLLISTAIGVFSYRRKSLSTSGVFGAILTGTTIFGFGGWIPGVLLVAFFASSTALGTFKARARAKQEAAQLFEKGGTRDIWQALANGGAGAAFGLFARIAHETGASDLHHALYAAMIGALATVNADTWATELGVLSRGLPRLITTFKPAPRGTSGAISAAGTLATAAGALFIGLVAYAGRFVQLNAALTLDAGARMAFETLSAQLLICALIGGVIGALSDSLLGATLQSRFFSAARDRATERAFDPDGSPNRHVGGWRWMNNDWVNFLSSLIGAAAAALMLMALM
jgi:uncharacterized protein (TIGR00297 family)